MVPEAASKHATAELSPPNHGFHASFGGLQVHASFGGLQVDDEFESRPLLDRQLGGFLADH